MNQNRYLLIHKTEWARMKRQQEKCEHPITNKEDYIKSLNEQSQNWTKNWPDTVQGHISQLEKQNKAEKLKLIDSVKEYVSKNKHERNIECIKKAKQLIFDDSSYGRQLLSALLASKTLEERDEQIKFKNKIKHEENVLRNKEPTSSSLQNANEMEINERKIKEYQKQNALEMAYANETMLDMQKRKKLLEKERTVQEEKYEDLMRGLLIEEEKKIMMNTIALHEESVKEYENINKKIKELKDQREKEDEKKRAIWQNYQDRVNYKKQIIFDEIHKNKTNLLQYRKVYETIKNLNEEKDRKYDQFVDKGIELAQERLKQEENEFKNKTLQYNTRKSLDEENKKIAELNCKMSLKNKIVCECHKQEFINKTKRKKDTSGSLFLKVENMLENLENFQKVENKEEEKQKKKSSLQNTHAYFAERATDTIRQCGYKNMALKVVHNYRKENCLDTTSLPVADF